MNTLSRTEIEQVIRELLHKYHAEYALLFGSYARGEATAASDIDVIVVGGANFRPRDIFAFGEELRQRTQKDVDFLFVDMPPGTGDVPLTVFQSLPVDGIVVVASPQELVSMIVAKAVNMAEMMKVPMLGIVENMSYIVCPDCGKKISVFGESHVDEVAAKHGLPVLAKCPIDPQLAACSDAGMIEAYPGQYLEGAADACEKLLKK